MRRGRAGERKAQPFEPPAGPRRVLDEKFSTEVIRLVQEAIEKKKSATALQEQEDE